MSYTLVIKFVVGKHSHHSDPSFMKVSQAPTVTERVKGDGNCFFFFFRSIALAVTTAGSQQDHQDFRLLMIHKCIFFKAGLLFGSKRVSRAIHETYKYAIARHMGHAQNLK